MFTFVLGINGGEDSVNICNFEYFIKKSKKKDILNYYLFPLLHTNYLSWLVFIYYVVKCFL